MAEFRVHRILLLVIALTRSLESTKLLAGFKKCGDLECETLISRVLAVRDYQGPDCRYLNFTKGEEISVYVKLAGEREDLWAGSKGKDFGYFPKDAVQIEEVFISEEVQVSTKESDFLCLLGVSYTFESEDSELNIDSGEKKYPYEEDKDKKYNVYENDLQIGSEFYSTFEGILSEDQFPASEAPEDIRSESNSWEEEKTASVEQNIAKEETQNHIPEVDHVLPSSTVSEMKGWIGLEKEQAEGKTFESVTEPLQESSFRSRKITVEDEDDLEELNNGNPQTEHKQEPELEFDSVSKKQSELESESEQPLKFQSTGWFGGGFTSYLGFEDEDTELELLSKETNPPPQDVPNSISSDEESIVPCTERIMKKEDLITNDSSIPKTSWFDFGFGMLGFAYASEDNIISPDGKNEEGSGVEKDEYPLTGEFDPNKEQEIEMIKIMENEGEIDKKNILKKTEDSDTLPYLKMLLYNFENPWKSQNIPKETELPIPEQILDQDNVIENDEREEISVENDPTDNIKVMMLESRYSKPDMLSKIDLSVQIPEVHFETLSSKNNDEKSKTSLETEGPTQEEIYRSVENTLLNSQMFSNDYALSPQKEDASEFQILKYLLQIDIYYFMSSAFSTIVILIERAPKTWHYVVNKAREIIIVHELFLKMLNKTFRQKSTAAQEKRKTNTNVIIKIVII